jgi:hypothetical protein
MPNRLRATNFCITENQNYWSRGFGDLGDTSITLKWINCFSPYPATTMIPHRSGISSIRLLWALLKSAFASEQIGRVTFNSCLFGVHFSYDPVKRVSTCSEQCDTELVTIHDYVDCSLAIRQRTFNKCQ